MISGSISNALLVESLSRGRSSSLTKTSVRALSLVLFAWKSMRHGRLCVTRVSGGDRLKFPVRFAKK